MANFYVTNNKFPTNPQLFTINLHKVVPLVPEDNPNVDPPYQQGESFWKLFIYTTGKDSGGDDVPPIVADVIGAEDTVNEFVENTIAELCSYIDWSQQGEFDPEVDRNAPVVTEQYPLPGQTGVPITSPVVIRVQDLLPGVGVDPASVVLKIDGHSVAPHAVEGSNKFDYTFSFSPRPIFDS